nr:response regulator [bacterium]
MTELKKIIYAEDEPDLQTVVEMTVQAMSDFEMKICDNGKILLDCVEEYSPDLIMLDVMMPELDGPSTFNKLKEMEK